MNKPTQKQWEAFLEILTQYKEWCEVNTPSAFNLVNALQTLEEQLPPSVEQAYED